MTRRKLKGRFPDKPKLRPADHTVDGRPLIVRKPDRKNGHFPALARGGEVVDCSAANPNRVYWYRRWQCGDVEIVGPHEIVKSTRRVKKPAEAISPPPPPPLAPVTPAEIEE